MKGYTCVTLLCAILCLAASPVVAQGASPESLVKAIAEGGRTSSVRP